MADVGVGRLGLDQLHARLHGGLVGSKRHGGCARRGVAEHAAGGGCHEQSIDIQDLHRPCGASLRQIGLKRGLAVRRLTTRQHVAIGIEQSDQERTLGARADRKVCGHLRYFSRNPHRRDPGRQTQCAVAHPRRGARALGGVGPILRALRVRGARDRVGAADGVAADHLDGGGQRADLRGTVAGDRDDGYRRACLDACAGGREILHLRRGPGDAGHDDSVNLPHQRGRDGVAVAVGDLRVDDRDLVRPQQADLRGLDRQDGGVGRRVADGQDRGGRRAVLDAIARRYGDLPQLALRDDAGRHRVAGVAGGFAVDRPHIAVGDRLGEAAVDVLRRRRDLGRQRLTRLHWVGLDGHVGRGGRRVQVDVRRPCAHDFAVLANQDCQGVEAGRRRLGLHRLHVADGGKDRRTHDVAVFVHHFHVERAVDGGTSAQADRECFARGHDRRGILGQARDHQADHSVAQGLGVATQHGFARAVFGAHHMGCQRQRGTRRTPHHGHLADVGSRRRFAIADLLGDTDDRARLDGLAEGLGEFRHRRCWSMDARHDLAVYRPHPGDGQRVAVDVRRRTGLCRLDRTVDRHLGRHGGQGCRIGGRVAHHDRRRRGRALADTVARNHDHRPRLALLGQPLRQRLAGLARRLPVLGPRIGVGDGLAVVVLGRLYELHGQAVLGRSGLGLDRNLRSRGQRIDQKGDLCRGHRFAGRLVLDLDLPLVRARLGRRRDVGPEVGRVRHVAAGQDGAALVGDLERQVARRCRHELGLHLNVGLRADDRRGLGLYDDQLDALVHVELVRKAVVGWQLTHLVEIAVRVGAADLVHDAVAATDGRGGQKHEGEGMQPLAVLAKHRDLGGGGGGQRRGLREVTAAQSPVQK